MNLNNGARYLGRMGCTNGGNRVKILALDPGDTYTGYCFIDQETLRPIRFGKEANHIVLLMVQLEAYDFLVIERVASYGMAVGKHVFETCEWVGRFSQASTSPVGYIYRQDEKLHICHDSRAKDANIRRALIDRFAKKDLKTGKGTKKSPDWFYQFYSDVWAAYAAGITYIETEMTGRASGKVEKDSGV